MASAQATPPVTPTAVLFQDLAQVDPEVAGAIDAELFRQRGTLEMIASENFAPIAVVQAQGSVPTNKYAEGYPGKRYYGGCEYVNVGTAGNDADAGLGPIRREQAFGEQLCTSQGAFVDLRDSELDGQQAEDRLHRVGITVNRNAVPFDPRPPMVSSGVRIGTPALAARGFGEEDFAEVADIIAEALLPIFDDAVVDKLRLRVATLTDRFPLYPQLAGFTS